MSAPARALIDAAVNEFTALTAQKGEPSEKQVRSLARIAVGVLGLALKDLNRIADAVERLARPPGGK